jgi:MerR family copper efflux transcriptional regulator
MLRYYESIGLVPAAVRTEGGYRTYGAREIETLRFIRRARDLGLSVDRIKLLVGLWQDRRRPSRDVKRIALAHVSELRTKIAELTAMCATLEELAAACHGDQRPDCPILRDLAGRGERKPAALAMPAANPVPRAGQTEGMPPTRNHRRGTGE